MNARQTGISAMPMNSRPHFSTLCAIMKYLCTFSAAHIPAGGTTVNDPGTDKKTGRYTMIQGSSVTLTNPPLIITNDRSPGPKKCEK
jgi:hypothetical protein